VAEIQLQGVTKRFPDGTEAVKHMDLDIRDGELMIFVGPSGCGKSTALRMIAGLEDISEGELRIGGEVVNERAPKDRDIAMVFQSYALYPHMNVRDNIAFPLKIAGADQSEIDRKVQEAARILDLERLLDRKPANLSGGQRQRVAMGRAIVRDPKAFLMDEPLSNLDAKLRVQMRTEVSRIQQRLGTTMVYVTHDQTEAMTLGDRVAVMRAGVLQQVDAPQNLYDNPVNLFVAGFIGSPAMNFFPARVENGRVRLPLGEVPVPSGVEASGDVIAGIRPEDFEDAQFAPEGHRNALTFEAPVVLTESMGSETYAYFTFEGRQAQSDELNELAADAGLTDLPSSGENQAVARLDPQTRVREGETARLWMNADKLHLFDPRDGRNLCANRGQATPATAGGRQASSPQQPVSGTGEATGDVPQREHPDPGDFTQR
jgi:multiple sugar transport system ATP-binding protein